MATRSRATGAQVIRRRFWAGLILTLGSLSLPATAGAVTAMLAAPGADSDGNFVVSWHVAPGPNQGGYTQLRQRFNGGPWI